MLDRARDSQKMGGILRILSLHHRDEVRDHRASVSSHFYVSFCLRVLLIL